LIILPGNAVRKYFQTTSPMYSLGIIGHGFVGKAVDHGFNKNVEKHIVDPKYGNLTTEQLITDIGPQAVFVCVPTPMNADGTVNASIVTEVLQAINEATPEGETTLTILKSTITPDFLKQYAALERLKLVYNPEFLTEKNYLEDFIKPDMQILGGDIEATQVVQRLYQEHSQCVPCPYHHTDLLSASFVKYTINTFLAQKVTYFNQMFDLWQAVNPDSSWDNYTAMVGADSRIGTSHMKVPGHDGQRGFSGSCFPKDTNGLVAFAKSQGVDFDLLAKVLEVNERLRE